MEPLLIEKFEKLPAPSHHHNQAPRPPKKWWLPSLCLPLSRKKDRPDHFQNWSGRPLLFQYRDMRFHWSFRRERVIAPTVPADRSVQPFSEMVGVTMDPRGSEVPPTPPIMQSAKKLVGPIIFKKDPPDPLFMWAGCPKSKKTVNRRLTARTGLPWRPRPCS
jgi:hypothetical protein